MKIAIIDVFRQKFLGVSSFHIEEWNMEFSAVDFLTTCSLEVPFTEKEIFSALKDANNTKSLASNGFSFKFAQSFWPIFKD